jgi:hypothetical protein
MDTLFITNESSGSSSDNEIICDEQSKKYEINQLIQKQIEDDLATHDFSKPHVVREEIQEMLTNWDNTDWQRQYLLHTYDTHKVPRKYFDADGVCRIDDFLKDTEKNNDFFFERIFIKVDIERHAETYSILGGNYDYYGTGKVVKYEPSD